MQSKGTIAKIGRRSVCSFNILYSVFTFLYLISGELACFFFMLELMPFVFARANEGCDLH
jgi:hypothetical protein